MAGIPTRLMTASTSSLNATFRGLSLNTSVPTIKRGFSTSSSLQKVKTIPEHIPPYPYKPNYVYKQADSGLYGGVTISFGNKISKGRNKGKTRRSWKPNVRWKKLPSEALGEEVFVKLTRKALRTIRKCGGLDNYLLCDKPSRLKELGLTGWKLRYRIMQSPSMKKKFAEEREKLGISKSPNTFEEWLKAKQLSGVTFAVEAIEDAREVTKVLEEASTNEETLPEPETLKGSQKQEQAPVEFWGMRAD
ncbi:50S ribosomal protein L24 [Talaromyces stipitatus ATCC 10500]|uniref:Large ribosomal subunit protein bL28m n=1 Tax=Talaromyces stipitatus (strain ATCC 10500 / CBS 375.48 / QM 6759 / NRRL 1006) TaxID=441959 RepID=B8LWP4_TALSN|nr:mitochondrial 54S ribosomal protein YmL24/YmL14 [Talaromyces stipitatus ATCC 10500]EED24441.1 50S ribosomal protein L24 [Talaromyces stipitatus ATCC 10500]